MVRFPSSTLKTTSISALKYPQFRKLIYGSVVVRTTDWMDLTIINWIVYQWTQSPVMLAFVNACRLLPVLLFTLPSGVMADKWDRQKLLMWTYLGLFLTSIAVAFVVSQQWAVTILLGTMMGRAIFMTVEVPVRQAFLSNVLPAAALSSGVAIQTMGIHLARMLGPAAAGILLLHIEAGHLLYILTIGPLVALIALWSMSLNPHRLQTDQDKATKQPEDRQQGNGNLSPQNRDKNDGLNANIQVTEKTSSSSSLKATFYYIKAHPMVLSVLLLAIAPMVFGFPYTTMLPLFSQALLGLGPDGFGLLLSLSSAGAILATVTLSVKQPESSGQTLLVSAFSFGLGLSFFMLFHDHIYLSILCMFFIGFVSQYYRTLSRIWLQLHVDEQYRGRVLSIALMDRGYIPLGAIFIGWIAQMYGVLTAGIFMGVGCCLSTLCLAMWRKDLWLKKGARVLEDRRGV
ncbi:MFS transporter [Caldalkalibacillus salinus]|uniref:MFS transporter n=1 Tax=Caldalkalibacillus salinus TaxID=2803787 RepID=UPI001921D16A|nr:MFS transporter [Caldalkalibacillus salinus]